MKECTAAEIDVGPLELSQKTNVMVNKETLSCEPNILHLNLEQKTP